MRIGLISLIVLLILPASDWQLLDNRTSAKKGSNSLWEKSSPTIRSLIKPYKSRDNELVLTIVGDPIQKKN